MFTEFTDRLHPVYHPATNLSEHLTVTARMNGYHCDKMAVLAQGRIRVDDQNFCTDGFSVSVLDVPTMTPDYRPQTARDITEAATMLRQLLIDGDGPAEQSPEEAVKIMGSAKFGRPFAHRVKTKNTRGVLLVEMQTAPQRVRVQLVHMANELTSRIIEEYEYSDADVLKALQHYDLLVQQAEDTSLNGDIQLVQK